MPDSYWNIYMLIVIFWIKRRSRVRHDVGTTAAILAVELSSHWNWPVTLFKFCQSYEAKIGAMKTFPSKNETMWKESVIKR